MTGTRRGDSPHPVADMLQTLLANPRLATDYRLNPHLTQADMAQTIRLAVECLLTDAQAENLAAEYEKALRAVQDTAFETPAPDFVGMPMESFQAVLDALAIPKTPR